MFMSTRAGIFTVAALVACVSLAQGVVSRPISEAPAGTVESRPLSLAKSEAAGAQAERLAHRSLRDRGDLPDQCVHPRLSLARADLSPHG